MKLELYYPISPWLVTQKFGETAYLSYYKENGINFKGHNGIDIVARRGQEVYASHDGICYVGKDVKEGNGVVIRTVEPFDFEDRQVYFKSISWHLLPNIPVKNGQKVKAGDVIGYADSSGLSTGDHLHYGLKPQLPGESNDIWYNFVPDNGYMGAVDPAPYFVGKLAEELSKNNYVFSINMEVGQKSKEVEQLQRKLQRLGYFPMAQQCTGYYGSLTRGAAFAFQSDYISLNWFERNIYRGRYFGQKSRAALNRIFR